MLSMAGDERRRPSDRVVSERAVYEPRVAVRRIRGALFELGTILVVGVLGYMVFEGWSFTDALYMTVITLTTVGYREVRTLDTSITTEATARATKLLSIAANFSEPRKTPPMATGSQSAGDNFEDPSRLRTLIPSQPSVGLWPQGFVRYGLSRVVCHPR
jgi:ion channel